MIDDPRPLEIVETGFTAFSGSGDDFASYGIVVRNPNEGWTAFRMEILLDLLDADGGFVAGDELVATLLPGQVTALAGEVFGAGRAASMAVRLPDDITAFVPATAIDGTFEIRDVVTTVRDGLNVTTGKLVSRSDRQQRQVLLAAVYRDVGGRIVGGAAGGVDMIDAGGEVAFEIIDSARFDDLATTEVHWQLSGVSP